MAESDALPLAVNEPPAVRHSRLTRFSWALFDWAQQPYHTLVGSFIFRPYFVAAIATTPERGQVLIGFAGAAAGLAVALAGPLVGSLIDARRNPKAWLALTSVPFVLSCAALWWAAPGASSMVPFILICLVVAALTAEITTAINNAMLPPIARPGYLGRLSGDAVALGYLAGIVATALFLIAFILPDEPLFGLDKAAREPDRLVGPIAALWYLVFVIPLFLFYPSEAAAQSRARPLDELWQLILRLPRTPAMFKFLVGRMLVSDGLSAGSVFAGIVAAATFDWGVAELGTFGLSLISCSGIGALLGGRFDDRIGSRPAVLITVVVLALGVAGAGSVAADRVFFVFPVAPPVEGDGFLAATSERLFLVFGMIIGFAAGPLTASMRTWMAELSPQEERGRWFGLYAFAGRATAFAGPLLVSFATLITGEVRSAIAVVFVFLAVGIWFFWGVPGRRTG